jgi:hypothetical protein
LKQSNEFESVAENIQVIHNKQTLGEFDFIVRRIANQQLIHVELVYKFYLFDPSVVGSEIEHWIGPNRGDQLDFKLEKLSAHQFPLLHHEAARETFDSLKINPSNIEQQVLFLANLFVPMDQQTHFEKVNPSAIEGRWMNASTWEKTSDSNHQFAIPEKRDWFAKALTDVEWFTKAEMLEKIHAKHLQKQSPLIYSRDENGNQRRDFVVWW